MSTTILVVEHEPRYAERIKEALHSLELHFAKDGDEVLHFVDQNHPSLIILSSVIPRVSTADLIRQIKTHATAETTPILITVAGYSGKNSRSDAVRLGANDIIPKPFVESLFAEKVQQLLAMHSGPRLTSDQIFGDLFSEEKPAASATRTPRQSRGDVDRLLEKTLSDIRHPSGARKKTEAESAAAAAPAKPKTAAGFDRRVEDTLSGLEKSIKPKTHPGKVVASPPPEPAKPMGEKVLASSPVITPSPPSSGREPVYEPGGEFGQYILVERIARGGMAEIWKARMRGLEGFEKLVAIKRILPHLSEDADFVSMFIDEAKLAAQLNHNNIVHIYDLGRLGSSYYIAMEHVEGHDLKDILKQAGERGDPMPIELALFVASKIAAALDYAHRKRDFENKELGIVHRDVSPQNVLISAEGDIKLCDFGIAKATSKVSHTQAGALKGKLQYMSPEQAWGRPIDRRSDIFALATVLFEMLTGRRLFAGDNEISVLEQVREAQVEPPSKFNEEAGAEIDALVLRALQRDPEARYQTAAEMARDIDAILYAFRPTPTSADLAIYMDRIYAPAPEPLLEAFEGPKPAEPVAVPVPSIPPPAATPSSAPRPMPLAPASSVATFESRAGSAPAARQKKRRLAIPLAAGLMLVAAAVVGAILLTGKRDAASATTVPARPAAVPAPAPASQRITTPPPVQLAATTAPPAELVPVVDTAAEQALINQEVQRRLAAERGRLEQQRLEELERQRQRAQSRERVEPRQSSAVAARTDLPPQQPSANVETATTTELGPATSTSPPSTALPEPSPQQEVVQTAREGDLIEAGTPGLVQPTLIDMKKVAYPPIARMQKVSGTVVLSALVSETGRVLEARVLRGVSVNVGINEAALEMVRGARFQPATKDGVRVKAYTTIVVPFKL
jgi:TonB family protein